MAGKGQAMDKDLQAIGGNTYSWIAELVDRLDTDDDEQREQVEQEIWESALEVSVRYDWHSPGGDDSQPTEYKILLSWGGPATQIVGGLSQYGEPETAELQAQDWFRPWETYNGGDESILLAFASQFYFGG